MRRLTIAVVICLSPLFDGCSAPGNTAATPATEMRTDTATRPAQTGSRTSRSVLTTDELMSSREGNVADAIAKLRPAWLRSKGSGYPAIFINAVWQQDGVAALQRLNPTTVAEARYYSIIEAKLQFGTDYHDGAIAVKLR